MSVKLVPSNSLAVWSTFRHVYVTRGVALKLDNDELQAVVFHELGHIAGWHLAQRWALLATVVGLIWLPRLARWQELQADAYAARVVGPMAMGRALVKLEPVPPRPSSFYPTLDERLKALALLLGSQP